MFRYAKTVGFQGMAFGHFAVDPGDGWVLVAETDPARPSTQHRRTLVDGVITWVDPRTLAEVKAAKNLQINSWRLQATYSGFMYAGKLIATDELSLIDLTNTGNQITRTGSLPNGWPGGWKAVDNSYVVISTVADWDAMYEAMYQQGLSNFVTSQILKGQVSAATSIAEVESIQWPV